MSGISTVTQVNNPERLRLLQQNLEESERMRQELEIIREELVNVEQFISASEKKFNRNLSITILVSIIVIILHAVGVFNSPKWLKVTIGVYLMYILTVELTNMYFGSFDLYKSGVNGLLLGTTLLFV